MVFQDPSSSLSPRLRVWQQVSEPLRSEGVRATDKLKSEARAALQQVGLSNIDLNAYPHQFSGGQKQRIAIARALIAQPRILVADEPLSSLDVTSQQEISRVLIRIKNELNLTLVLISHDLASIRSLTERVYIIYMGEVMEQGPTDTVFSDPQHPYTQMLIASAPKPGVAIDDQHFVLPPQTETGEQPAGCPFATRCPLVLPHCSTGKPSLKAMSGGGYSRCWLHDQPL
jgi:oligopeptide/dipeptide ABC transporter ATP-binding protein